MDNRDTTFADMSDEALAEAVKKGDDPAYEALVKRYTPALFRFVRQYSRAESDAEDVIQETFFKAWRSMARFKEGRAFRPWLYTIARNTALDHIKKRRASAFSELDNEESDLAFADTLEDAEPLAPELFERGELSVELDAALGELHPDHRAVMVMHYQEELTFDEISAVMGKPMNTVKSWHRRALQKIKGLMQSRTESGGGFV